jgi:hypothetical protein
LAKAAGDGRTGQSGAPPHQPTIRVRSWSTVGGFVLLRHRTVWCHTGQSGAPLTFCSDFCRGTVLHCLSVRVDRCAQIAFAPLAHRTIRWHTDSPVNYSGARLRFTESGWLKPVRTWCTRQCPVRHLSAHSSSLLHFKLCP